jgi:hypothetical protein
MNETDHRTNSDRIDHYHASKQTKCQQVMQVHFPKVVAFWLKNIVINNIV